MKKSYGTGPCSSFSETVNQLESNGAPGGLVTTAVTHFRTGVMCDH